VAWSADVVLFVVL